MRLLSRLLATLGLARLRLGGEPMDEEVPPRRSDAIFVVLALAAGLVLSAAAGATLALLLLDRQPADNSAEAGFARDMMTHHAQAVDMAELARERTESEEIRTLATDIAFTQQAQIGQMQGWLAVWGLPATSKEPAMSWMGHPTEGRMPGMASTEEIEELRRSSAEEADALFLQLMIPHHEAALPMAEAILERTDRPEVRQLAEAIYNSQQSEIKVMNDMLLSREASPLETEPSQEDRDLHSGHASVGQQQEEEETAASLAHGAILGAVVLLGRVYGTA